MTDTDGFRTLTASDGNRFDCWIEPAHDRRKGGLVILQEIFGVTDQLKGVARMYAAHGYEVAIPALFDRREPGTVVPFDQGTKGRELMLSLPADEVMHDVDAAAKALRENGGGIAVMGFCWGGGLALRAAQTLEIDAAVAFYGTRLQQYLSDDLKAPVQFHAGLRDDHVPENMRAETAERFPEIEWFLYDAGHAFANDARPSYVADAAETAHERARKFLDGAMA